MRAPISRISPRARNWCSSRMVPADVHTVGLDGTAAVGVNYGVNAQQPAADVGLAKPYRRSL